MGKPPRKKLLQISGVLLGVLLLGVAAINPIMVRQEKPYLYAFDRMDTVPQNDVGLVLGTISTLANGATNLHFQYRMEAATLLYKRGKVKHLILSGDNHRHGYNEPEDMKRYLLKEGVPANAMTLDYAGFRTLDSLVRAKEVFGQNRLTLITDEFHAARAVFLGRSNGMNVIAFCSETVPPGYISKAEAREYGARIKAFFDVYVLRTKPRFLGEKITLPVSSPG